MGQCSNSTVVDAPVEQVWNLVKNFHDLSWAPNVISSLEKVGAKGPTEVGAGRKLNDAISETLIDLDEPGRSFRYRITDGPPPLSADNLRSYYGIVRVFPVTDSNRTFVLWTSEYETTDDEAVHEFCDPIYQALLKDLVQRFSS